jgi:hypothetical protein
MLNKMILPVIVTALAILLLPSEVRAYGAAHVGYTHVGPNGVYHAGATAVRGPGGGYAGGYRGGAYGGAYGGAAYGGAAYGGAAYGGYHYTTGYGGSAAYGSAHYAYVR